MKGEIALLYKARSKETGAMWDVWMTHHGGLYYLYLACDTKTDDRGANNISLATSSDGVHWMEVGPVIVRDEGKKFLGSGSTWRNPVPNATPRFQTNYSCHGPERQTIFFAQSEDLIHWTKCGPAHEFVQDERWYERNGRWDCIWTLARPGGGLYGYWTATPKPETCGRFGFGESLDGITWRALKPPYVIGVGAGEVGAIEKAGGRAGEGLGERPHRRLPARRHEPGEHRKVRRGRGMEERRQPDHVRPLDQPRPGPGA